MLSAGKILIIISAFFLSIKIYSQHKSVERVSLMIDSLIKKDQYDLVHFKLDNEGTFFRRLSKYPPQYDLLIKLDSASVLYRKGKYLESKKSILLTINEIQNKKKELDISHYESLKHIASSRLFYIEKSMGNIPRGLKYLNSLSKDMNPKYEKKNRIYFAIAHIEVGNYQKGIDLLNLHIKDIKADRKNHLYSKTLKGKEIASSYNTKGNAFLEWYKDSGKDFFLDSAQYNYDNAYHIVEKSTDISHDSKFLHNLRYANIALLKKKYEYSLSLFNKCEQDSALMERYFSRESVFMGKAEAYTFLKKPGSTFYYINIINNEKNLTQFSYDNQLRAYHLLSTNYENLGDHEKAYQYAKLSLSEMKKKKLHDASLSVMLVMHEQQKINSASTKIIEEQKRKTFISALLAILTFGIITSYVIYNYNKRKLFFDDPKKIIKKEDNNAHLIVSEKTENITVIEIEDELVNRILKKMDSMEAEKKFLSNNFKLANLAKQLNTNTAYLSQIINQHKGISFSEYVNNLRINYVVEELHNNSIFRKYTIQTISEEIGYKSTTTFINAFKSRVNMTPSSYVQHLEKNEFSKSMNPVVS